MRDEKRNLMWLAAMVVCAAALVGTTSRCISAPLPVPARSFHSGSSQVAEACELIYQGKFEDAERLTKRQYGETTGQLPATARQLVQILDEYKEINRRRELSRGESYEETLAELEKLKAARATDANDVVDTLDVE